MASPIGNNPLNRFFLFFASMLVLSACSISQPAGSPIQDIIPTTDASARGWWRASYEIDWPVDQDPSWHMDVMLAQRVIAPVLKEYRPVIELWRFHRRAARDGAGHRFSFLFYSTPDIAGRIFKLLKSNPVVLQLVSDHRLVRIDYDDPRQNLKPKVQDTSDPVWPLMVRKTWPSFIMGASEMWLGLIGEIAEQLSGKGKTDDEQRYRDIEAELDSLWREQGQHPFLHHLNALFGYEDMLIINRKGEAMRF